MTDKKRFGLMASLKPVEDYFDYAKEHNIRHIEIDLKKKHSQLKTFSTERIKNIREFSQANDISLSLHSPFNINLCSPVFIVRLYYTSFLKKSILLARQLHARHITLHLGNFHRSAAWDNPRENALERLCRVLKKVLPFCEEHHVILALENVTPTRQEVGFSFLGDNINDLEYIFSYIQSPYMAFCLDTGHANTNEGVTAYIGRLGDKISCVHFHDNRGMYDDHLNVGAGTVPWKALGESLEKISFNGPYITECFKSQPHEAIEQYVKFTAIVPNPL